ncbi:MAG: cohesin domain-containing protein [Ardenticatenaceae bacterium]
MVHKDSLSLFLLLLFLSITTSVYAQEPSPARVTIEPTTITVGLGQTVDVAVVAHDVQQLYGIDLSLTFNPQAIEIVDADPNSDGVQVGFGTFLEPGFTLRNQVDNQTGTIRFAMTQVSPSEPKNGSGALIVMTLRGREQATNAQLTLTDVELGQATGIILENTTNPTPVEVNVVESLSAQSTPLPQQNSMASELGQALGTPFPSQIASEQATTADDIFIAIGLGIVLVLLVLIALALRQIKRQEAR